MSNLKKCELDDFRENTSFKTLGRMVDSCGENEYKKLQNKFCDLSSILNQKAQFPFCGGRKTDISLRGTDFEEIRKSFLSGNVFQLRDFSFPALNFSN